MKKKIMVDVSKINWKLLRKQKDIMCSIMNVMLKTSYINTMNGVLCLLDDVQDQAAEQIGREKVFGERIPKCKECGKNDKVEAIVYKNGDRYWECERCWCVVSRRKS